MGNVNRGKNNKNSSALKKSFEKTIHINHNYSHNIMINIDNRNPSLKKSITKEDIFDSKKSSEKKKIIKKSENNNKNNKDFKKNLTLNNKLDSKKNGRR